MSALSRRLKNVERAILPDCENCPHNRVSRLSEEEIEHKIKESMLHLAGIYGHCPLEEINSLNYEDFSTWFEMVAGRALRDRENLNLITSGKIRDDVFQAHWKHAIYNSNEVDKNEAIRQLLAGEYFIEDNRFYYGKKTLTTHNVT